MKKDNVIKNSVLESCLQIHDMKMISDNQINSRVAQVNQPVLKALFILKCQNARTDYKSSLLLLDQAKKIIKDSWPHSASQLPAYQSVLLSIMTKQLNIRWLQTNYTQAKLCLQQLKTVINKGIHVQQVLFTLFQIKSLKLLADYNIKENIQFRFPTVTQVHFLYLIGRVKLATNHKNQAMQVFQHILDLSKSVDIPSQMQSQTKQLLEAIQNKGTDKTAKEMQYFKELINEMLILQKKLVYNPEEEDQSLSNCIPFVCTYLRWHHKKDLSQISIASQKTIIKYHPKKHVCASLKSTRLYSQALKFFQHSLNKLMVISVKNQKKYLKSSFIIFSHFVEEKQHQKENQVIEKKVVNSKLNDKKFVSNIDKKIKEENIKKFLLPPNKEQAQQILRSCFKGSFLVKLNFGNYDYSTKFVKITEKSLKWGQSKQDIGTDFSEIKWKHTLGIVYGKVSPNMVKKTRNDKQPWQCFSLITKDRSIDFYCQNEKQVFFWLQGISLQLQKFHKSPQLYPFYSKGRALWKMALLKMKFCFLSSKEEKKYKIVNCGAVISFKKQMVSLQKSKKTQ